MMATPGNLQVHVAESGGASSILHGGPGKTREIEVKLDLRTELGRNDYEFRLFHAAGDALIFAEERYRFSRGVGSLAPWIDLGAGHRESKLIESAASGKNKTASTILSLLRKLVVYQFHNTSSTARMRNKWQVDDNRWLKEDAGNLAPFLLRLRTDETPYYQRIVETLRLILPFFADFEFDVESKRFLLLRWRERSSDIVFGASQAGDGMLRVMALVSLLLQPERDLPDVLILDEPELGLHPYAINIVSELIRSVSTSVQVILATQSVTLINHFKPEEIVVVERSGSESTLRRLDSDQLKDWLSEYSVSELWEKNVLGGRPT
jgi:predicted ATPase